MTALARLLRLPLALLSPRAHGGHIGPHPSALTLGAPYVQVVPDCCPPAPVDQWQSTDGTSLCPEMLLACARCGTRWRTLHNGGWIVDGDRKGLTWAPSPTPLHTPKEATHRGTP